MKFLSDTIEPSKQYIYTANRNYHTAVSYRDNNYNELDVTDPMNKHAVTCELQRTILSISCLMNHDFNNINTPFEMITELESDSLGGTEVPATYVSSFPDGIIDNFSEEEWLFVNGICGEYYWLHLYCQRLAIRFQRKITGIFIEEMA